MDVDVEGFTDELEISRRRRGRHAPRKVPRETALAIADGAHKLGIIPVDLATVISYETKGTYDPSIRGGYRNRYIGLSSSVQKNKKSMAFTRASRPGSRWSP